jgi:hypothetical protein
MPDHLGAAHAAKRSREENNWKARDGEFFVRADDGNFSLHPPAQKWFHTPCFRASFLKMNICWR